MSFSSKRRRGIRAHLAALGEGGAAADADLVREIDRVIGSRFASRSLTWHALRTISGESTGPSDDVAA